MSQSNINWIMCLQGGGCYKKVSSTTYKGAFPSSHLWKWQFLGFNNVTYFKQIPNLYLSLFIAIAYSKSKPPPHNNNNNNIHNHYLMLLSNQIKDEFLDPPPKLHPYKKNWITYDKIWKKKVYIHSNMTIPIYMDVYTI